MYIRSKNGNRKCKNCKAIKPLTDFEFFHSSGTYCRRCTQCSNRQARMNAERIERRKELIKSGLQQCNKCNTIKPVGEFNKDSSKYGGLARWCKTCQYQQRQLSETKMRLKDWSLKKTYGITLDDFNNKYQAQQGKCAICMTDISAKSACVDHCHTTGRVRDLLCSNCNWGIGAFKERPEILESAIRYVLKHSPY